MSKCPFSFLSRKSTGDSKGSSAFFETAAARQDQVMFQVGRHQDVIMQSKLIQLTKEDLADAKALQPLIIEEIEGVLVSFYENLQQEPALTKIIEDNSTVERLQKTLRRHLIEMFSGEINEAFIEQRGTIARVHVRIGLQPKWYMCAFQDLLLTFLDILDRKITHKNEYVRAVKVVTKIISLEQQLVLEAYEQENERIREDLANKRRELQMEINRTAENLAAISEQTSASIEMLNTKSTQMASFAKNGSYHSMTAEERSLKGKQMLDLEFDKLTGLTKRMEEIGQEMKALEQITGEITNIVNVVTSIAEQTNLLSLNASIEAARAGEQGRGFAVVAGEVRTLSEETKKSASGVAELVSKVSQQSAQVSGAVRQIEKLIVSCAETMEETNTFFEEILGAVSSSKEQSSLIELELEHFSNVIKEISQAAMQVAVSADELTEITQQK
ncbi:MAG: globin-coupled sensor protein [Tumebacillaceae bacterium]